jgi:uncharacterized LabA/DUF88 family protein
MNRTIFIVDGFNMYHSVEEAARQLGLGSRGTKWLDLRSLCSSYLHVIGGGAQLERVYYFSALAKHLEASKPDVTLRHKTYVRALESTGVTVQLSRFKAKEVRCPKCGARNIRHEEKETDVALAAKLLEVFARDECDTVVLVTGDTDIAPAVRTAAVLYPAKKIAFAFPFARKNKELAQLVRTSFQMRKESYSAHQLRDPLQLADGSVISKPAKW